LSRAPEDIHVQTFPAAVEFPSDFSGLFFPRTL
jgi:hypothetical protein